MIELIKWYYNLNEFTPYEKNILKTGCSADVKHEYQYNLLVQDYFDRMPFCNIDPSTHWISFEKDGTTFINNIFEKEVDEKTLVISTVFEHNSVKENLKNHNTYLFKSTEDIRNFDFSTLKTICKGYDKVFVYIIGTRIDTGEVIPQWFFNDLDNELNKLNIPHKIMLDDVHGMFLIPRDYSLFDYVLYTAHAIVKNYDMGLLISKNNNLVGQCAYNWGKDYLERLDILLNRYSKIEQFYDIMTQYFNKLLNDPHLELYEQTVGHIFSIKTTNLYFSAKELEDLSEKYMIENSGNDSKENWLRWRFQEFISLSEDEVIEGIKTLEKIINKAIMKAKMRESFND